MGVFFNGPDLFFQQFLFFFPFQGFSIFIFQGSRESSNGLVVGQLPNVDYIVEINGNAAEAEVKILSACLRGFQGIQAAITINPSKIKISEPFCPE